MKIKYLLINLVRWIGKQVCNVKGHNFYYPGGEVRTWNAYSCIRCGEFDRPIESLPNPPEDFDYGFDLTETPEYQEMIDQEHERERRWITWLPFPHWI